MIKIKSKNEIDIMRVCGHVTGTILRDLAGYIEPGMSTQQINDYVEQRIRKEKMTPSFSSRVAMLCMPPQSLPLFRRMEPPLTTVVPAL